MTGKLKVPDLEADPVKEAIIHAAQEETGRAHEAGVQATAARLKGIRGNHLVRNGLTDEDARAIEAMLRDEVPWDRVVKDKRRFITLAALEAWRPELERRAALPPGGERTLLGSRK